MSVKEGLEDSAARPRNEHDEVTYQRDLVRTIADNAGSALFMMDAQGYPIYMNQAACEMTGYSGVEEIRGRPLHYAVHFRKPDGSPYPMDECPIDRANAQIKPLRNQREIFCRKDGSLFPVEYNVAPIVKDGRQAGAVLEVRDITEQLRAAEILEERVRARTEELREANHELAEANGTLEAFNYVVAHDLKEPVRAVDHFLTLAAEADGEPDRRDAVERAREHHARLQVLLRGLLEYGRIGMGDVEPRPTRVDELVRAPEVAGYYTQLVQERGAQVEVADHMPAVRVSPILLGQLLGNLILNALRHHGGAAPWVRVSAEASATPGHVDLLIEDNGPGFGSDVLRRFAQLQGRRPATIKGGFGLVISHRAAQRMGATLTLENREQGGGRVRLTLPRA